MNWFCVYSVVCVRTTQMHHPNTVSYTPSFFSWSEVICQTKFVKTWPIINTQIEAKPFTKSFLVTLQASSTECDKPINYDFKNRSEFPLPGSRQDTFTSSRKKLLCNSMTVLGYTGHTWSHSKHGTGIATWIYLDVQWFSWFAFSRMDGIWGSWSSSNQI